MVYDKNGVLRGVEVPSLFDLTFGEFNHSLATAVSQSQFLGQFDARVGELIKTMFINANAEQNYANVAKKLGREAVRVLETDRVSLQFSLRTMKESEPKFG